MDGAAEEGTPFVPARGMRRVTFIHKPAGFRFYHTHVAAGPDLNRGTYTGQAGPIYIEPQRNRGAYDREVFLVMKEFAPAFSHGGDMAMDALTGVRFSADAGQLKAVPVQMKRMVIGAKTMSRRRATGLLFKLRQADYDASSWDL